LPVDLFLREPFDFERAYGAALREEITPGVTACFASYGDLIALKRAVEQSIIREEFKEPRIHFALVCAARSCPPLRSEAYSAERLEQQLEDQARVFLLRTPQANRIDPKTGTVWVSPVLVWYREDFGGTDQALGRFLARYWPQGPERTLLLSDRFRLRETEYDWTLNSIEKGRLWKAQ
jgi:hypothetical protein